MSLIIVNSFQLLPLDIHGIIQQFVSAEDCVSMCKVSHHMNTVWKNFIENTIEKRMNILRYILNSSYNLHLEQDAMLIKRLMCPHVFRDLVLFITGKRHGFFSGFLHRVLYSMTDVSHLRRIIMILEHFEQDKCWISKKGDGYYKKVIKYIKTSAVSCWKIDVLIDVLNWLSTKEWWLDYPKVDRIYSGIFREFSLRDNCAQNAYKMATLLHLGPDKLPATRESLYAAVISQIAENTPIDTLIKLISLVDVKILMHKNVMFFIFRSVLIKYDYNKPYESRIKVERAIKLWKTLSLDVKRATFESVLKSAAVFCTPFAEFLWTKEQASIGISIKRMSEEEIYMMLTCNKEGIFDDKYEDCLNWIYKRLGPIFMPAFLAEAIDRNDFSLVFTLIKNPEVSVNSSYRGKNVLQRLMIESLPFRERNYFHIFTYVIDNPNFDFESNKQRLLQFINNSSFNNQLVRHFKDESETFKKRFKCTQIADGSNNNTHYHVTLLNPSKKQKVV